MKKYRFLFVYIAIITLMVLYLIVLDRAVPPANQLIVGPGAAVL